MPLLRYLLCTNAVSNFFRHQLVVTARFRDTILDSLVISTLTVTKIKYGPERQPAARSRFGTLWTTIELASVAV